MPAPTRRSKTERDLYPHDNTVSRVNNNKKVVKLDPPDRIQDNSVKLDCWNYICNDLAEREILSPSYFMPITILVDNIFTYNEYLVMLEGSGPLIPVMTKDGSEVQHYKENPLFNMIKKCELIINKMCEKFGLNPRDAVYVTNPDIKTQQVLEAKQTPDRKAITYFQ
jgi:hypothetical protein